MFKPDLEERFATSNWWKINVKPLFQRPDSFWAEEEGIMRCPGCERSGEEDYFEQGLCKDCFQVNLHNWVVHTDEGKESAKQDNTYEIWYRENK